MNEKAKELIKEHYTFEDLTAIIALLRSEGGCAWDRAQTHESIRKNLIEECYEAVEGIDKKDPKLLCEELGDLLLQVVFHARMSEEAGEFSIDDAVNGVCRKMVSRHPHVFGDAEAFTPDTALRRWEEIKEKEKKEDSLEKALTRVSRTLPSLMRTQKLLKKSQSAGQERYGTARSADELKKAYFDLCRDALASGIDLEELGYKANEEYIKAKIGELKDADR